MFSKNSTSSTTNERKETGENDKWCVKCQPVGSHLVDCATCLPNVSDDLHLVSSEAMEDHHRGPGVGREDYLYNSAWGEGHHLLHEDQFHGTGADLGFRFQCSKHWTSPSSLWTGEHTVMRVPCRQQGRPSETTGRDGMCDGTTAAWGLWTEQWSSGVMQWLLLGLHLWDSTVNCWSVRLYSTWSSKCTTDGVHAWVLLVCFHVHIWYVFQSIPWHWSRTHCGEKTCRTTPVLSPCDWVQCSKQADTVNSNPHNTSAFIHIHTVWWH